ncbi:MAG: hypothetical protein ACOCWQ_00625 [Nanoarchaeota archaeon]
MSKIFSLVAILLIAFLTLPLSSAQDSYTLQAQGSTVRMDACSIVSERITLRNTGSNVIRPKLTAGSEVEEWVDIVPSSKLLAPGEELQSTVFIHAPCRKEGVYDLKIHVENTETPKVLQQQLIVEQAQTIRFSIGKAQISTCPCEPVEIPYTLTNPSGFAETYRISAAHEEYVFLPNNIRIAPGESIQGVVRFMAKCQDYGDYSDIFLIEAQNSGARAAVSVAAEVDPCYDFTLESPDNVMVCDNSITFIPVNLTNIADIPNTYRFTIREGPEWAQLTGSEVSLLPGQSGLAYVQTFPRQGLGNDSLLIAARSEMGNLQASKRIRIDVPVCYAVNISTTSRFDVCEEVARIPVSISNLGRYNVTYNMSLQGPLFTSLDQGQIRVPAGTSQNLTFIVNATAVKQGEYFARIQAMQADNPLIMDSMDIRLEAHSDQDCYRVEFSPTEFVLNRTGQAHALNMTHKGLRSAEYDLSLSNTSIARLSQDSVNLSPEGSVIIALVTNTSNTTPSAGYWTTIQAQTHGIIYTEQLLLDLDAGVDITRILVIAIILALILILILLIVTLSRPKKRGPGRPKGSTKKKQAKRRAAKRHRKTGIPTWLLWLLIILGILILLGILIVLLWLFVAPAVLTIPGNMTNITGNATQAPGFTPLNQTGTPVVNETDCGIWCGFTLWVRDLFNRTAPLNDTVINPSINITDNATDAHVTQNMTEEHCGVLCTIGRWWSSLFEPVNITANITANITEGNMTNITKNVTTNISLNQTNISNVTVPSRQQALARIDQVLEEANATGRIDTFEYQVWKEGETHMLNLSRYFVDPDNDTITFSHFAVDGINISVQDGVARFVPEEEFIGVRYTSFVATDSSGATARSPVVTLVVRPDDDAWDAADTVFAVLLVLFVLAIVALLDILVRKGSQRSVRKDKRAKKK